MPSTVSDGQDFLQQNLALYLNGDPQYPNAPFPGFLSLFNTQVETGPWDIVWGPCVYLAPGCNEATNAMFVAKTTDTSVTPNVSTYVVAIAATNPASLYDWIDEDAQVEASLMVPWPLPKPYTYVHVSHPVVDAGSPFISAGTALGISNLLNNVKPAGGPGIADFLAQAANPNDTVIFAGHSLAGALTPTLAFHLYPDGAAGSGWKQVLVLPTAGATPGNGAPGLLDKNPTAFSQLFTRNFPQISTGFSPYTAWNTDYANQADVVPHAWNQLGDFMPVLNGTVFSNPWGVLSASMAASMAAMLTTAEGLALGGFYENLPQITFPPPGQMYSWTLNQQTGQYGYPPAAVDAPVYTAANPLSTQADFGSALKVNHVEAYYFFFGVLPPPRMPPTGLVPVPLETDGGTPAPKPSRKDLVLHAARLSA
ncbi:hypothetical protein M2352_000282 [Azospirillum fermentarium]|uniref:hypothetical protein n=1 Tax=Azospirillum fermentarium TaxID=1233114 RepID=UPI0022274147|nr:hypothetical protein [Azospirillum fermentarium]MCW2244691.1 hypothetical protein [Azospirillum fermentarium]